MRVLAWGLGLFALALLAHLALWRVRRPRRHIRALLRLFAAALAAGLLLLRAGADGGGTAGFCELAPTALLFLSLTLAYIATYTAVQVDSPSLVMVLAVARAGDRGVSRAELEAALTDDLLVTPRLDDLVRDEVATCRDGVYRLTGRGLPYLRLIRFWRRLMGLPEKGG
jgi:hypothetical protein